ncbi:Acyl-CoA reductase [Handroanthus impetiginosus]|uniref:Fatty acyl-CoA reductase n=1 Tax=Handroanthus impetiginosus TaxID=429701 RepID=A0A2G9HSK6_9LAMI|nr:Acyl-CoA reductase [Handroanthus impetiginosus]
METLSLSSASISLASNNHALMRVPSKHNTINSTHMVYNCQNSCNHAVKPIPLLALTGPCHSNGPVQPQMVAGRHGSSDLSPNRNDFVMEMHHHGIGIADFLRGKTFLVRGATGFLAKEKKILGAALDVDKIFVLIKAKDKEAAVRRLKNEIIGAELFKLVPLVGNVRESNLGLDEDAAELIARQVDIIINSAANTTFDERYDTALDINTGGPMRIIGLAKQCYKLKLFLHVSTAYVNGQRQGRIMEKPFCLGQSCMQDDQSKRRQPSLLPKLSVEDEINLVLESKQALEDHSLHQKMKKIRDPESPFLSISLSIFIFTPNNTFGWQDTYAFTKAMGEMTIDSVRGDIPVVVIRPSFIESTYKELFPGWIEGNRMMDPIIMLYIWKGVPADMVVHATLAAMAKHGGVGGAAAQLEISSINNIYQVASSVVNPLVFRDLFRFFYKHFNSSPFIDSKGSPIGVTPLKLFSSMEDLSTDLRRNATNRGASAKLVRKSVEQAKYLANIYQPYTFYRGRFDNSNTKRLMECIIDWEDYIINVHIPGLRRHVFKGRYS